MDKTLLASLIGIAVTATLKVWNIEQIRNGVFSSIGKLPRRAQWIAPLVLAMLAATGEGYLNGLTGEDLLQHGAAAGGEAGVLAIGFWHVLKRFFAEGAPTVGGASALLLVGLLGFGQFGCSRAAIDNQIDKAVLYEQQMIVQVDYMDSVFNALVANPEIPVASQAEFRRKFADAKAWFARCMQAKDAALRAAKDANAEVIDMSKLVADIVAAVQGIIGVMSFMGASPEFLQEQQTKTLTLSRGL
jgi:hypothetical protein